MLKCKGLLKYTNLFSPNKYKESDKKKLKIYCNVCNKYKKFKNPKMSYIFKKTLSLSIVYSECGLLFTVSVVMNVKKYLKKKNQMKY